MGLESEATVANFGLNSRGAIPRLPIDNVQGNAVQLGNNRDYSFLTRNAVLAARSINALKTFEAASPPPATRATARSRSSRWATASGT